MSEEQNVCENQEIFNTAVKEALENYKEEEQKTNKNSTALYVLYTLSIIVFLVWAIYLVTREKRNDERVIHFLYAIILSPIYVLSYYLNEIY